MRAKLRTVSNDPTARALQLLSLLQTHRLWRGAELAERLEVTERTIRRDIDRLRDLGYPVDATSGADGGYRLGVGAHLPPLLLDDDEAVAVAIGLRYAASAAIDGMQEASLRSLGKVESLLPDRLRRRLSALHSSVTPIPPPSDETIDPEALSTLAASCRDREEVRFDYRGRNGERSRRLVEPHQLVAVGRRWYLLAWDLRSDDFRTFRLDRLAEPRRGGKRFRPRAIPEGDAARFVAASLGPALRQREGTLVIAARIDEISDALRWIDHTVVEPAPTTGGSSVVRVRSEDIGRLAMSVARIALTAPVEVLEPTELAEAVKRLTANCSTIPSSRDRQNVSDVD